MPTGRSLYDQDFFLWTQEQAAALRRAKDSNLPLDWENLAEEVESLGKSDRREITSQLRRILRHLFKFEASPAAQSRAGWRSTIVDARSEIEGVLEDSPSLRRQIDFLVRGQLNAAAALASSDLSHTANRLTRSGSGFREAGLPLTRYSETGSRNLATEGGQAWHCAPGSPTGSASAIR